MQQKSDSHTYTLAHNPNRIPKTEPVRIDQMVNEQRHEGKMAGTSGIKHL